MTKVEDPFAIEFDPDRRAFFRVEPSEEEPVSFQTAEGRYAVVDLSAGGLSIVARDVEPGQRVKGRLWLPRQTTPVNIDLEIISLAAGDQARGSFADLGPKERERIHFYVLQRQKSEIEERRQKQRLEDLERSS
ncbi:MAG: PilZ domain-containing protein [Deltaproteobacteria bacterium]|nr:PilZ domain-containing protein [Deltaproteobacteria bacterium]